MLSLQQKHVQLQFAAAGSTRHSGVAGLTDGLHLQCYHGRPAAHQILHVPITHAKLPTAFCQRAPTIPPEQPHELPGKARIQGEDGSSDPEN